MVSEPVCTPALPALPASASGGRVRVVHLLMAGGIDGIGLHVLDLARAQMSSGRLAPIVVTCPSSAYARRLRAAEVPFLELRTARLLPALARAERSGFGSYPADVLHLHGHRASQFLLAAKALKVRFPATPIVATCHGLLHDSIRRRARTWSELRSYRYLRRLITTSPEQCALVAARTHHPPVSYVANGVPLPPAPGEFDGAAALARHGVPPGGEVIGAVGRLSPEKRHDLFLAAGRRIAAERPAARFLVVGEGRELRRLQAVAGQFGIADRTHFVGMIDDVPALCTAMSLLMHASDTEGTPRAVLEAMAASVPVVATSVGGVPMLVEDGITGILTRPGDAGALAKAALGLLADPARARCMGERGRGRVAASFTASAMADRVEDLYRRAGVAVMEPR